MSSRFLFLALAACLIATDAPAQTFDRLDRRDKLLGFEAVGRLDGPNGRCTGALIARDVVLTAAHCVEGKGTDFVFRAGYSDGSAIATRTVSDIAIAPGYAQALAKGDRPGAVANDVALVRLTSPIYEPGANPYQIASMPGAGTPLTLASYGQGRIEALTLERGCAVNTFYRDGVVGIDCDATFGSSGAPVFVDVAGRTRIFSIISSGGIAKDGSSETLGVELTALVPELMAELRTKRPLAPVSDGPRRIIVGGVTTPSGGGAKFVKPGG